MALGWSVFDDVLWRSDFQIKPDQTFRSFVKDIKCEPWILWILGTLHFFKLPHRHRIKYSYSSKPPGAASRQASRHWPMGTGKIKVHLISCLSLFILSISFSVFTVFHQCNPPHSLCLFSALPQERRPNSPSVFVLMWSICGLMSSMITVFTATHAAVLCACVCVCVIE